MLGRLLIICFSESSFGVSMSCSELRYFETRWFAAKATQMAVCSSFMGLRFNC